MKKYYHRHELFIHRVVWFAGLILSGVFVSFFGGAFPYLLFYMILFLPVLSLFYLIYVYFRFCVYQHIAHKKVRKEEEIPYEFILGNEDFITYAYVHVNFLKENSRVGHLEQEMCYSLLPGEMKKYTTTLVCKYRGEYLVGIDKVIIRDYFGLFQFTYTIPTKIEATVLPRIVKLSHLSFWAEEDAKQSLQNSTSLGNIPDVEMRNYVSGDSMRRIHWKASAKEGKLLVRNYQEEPKNTIMLLLDGRKLNDDEHTCLIVEDKIIEAFLAITQFFLERGTPVLDIYDVLPEKNIVVRNKQRMEEVYSICSGFRFSESNQITHFFHNAFTCGQSSSFLIVITHTIDDEFRRNCYQELEMGKRMAIIMVGREENRKIVQHLDQRIVSVFISLDEEVKSVLEKSR